ncbi:MAG: hypothetical protein CL943_04050 [Candidatus Diapherotrites archaeon]|uniref:Mechanosensitive ion channel n=1 Tax=Candidatus Iainarchaeum sp. TaxID=3101447 RepID=A0A2D6M205_9ARCH|nr:hypothetical protein [Candidatus Diapherotrites archaeon]|tara:strand:- start:3303 stop:4055 length:753 start_codon:yes stop_codon:yes gene_type:complete
MNEALKRFKKSKSVLLIGDSTMVDLVSQFSDGMKQAAFKIWDSFVDVVPALILAIAIIVIGWFLGKIIKKIVIKILQSTKIDQWIDEQNLTAAIGGKEMSALIGSFVKWYIIWVSLWVAADSIKLQGLSQFVEALVFYIPQVLAALLVMILGLLLGRYLKNALDATQHRFKKMVSSMTELIVVLFAGILALTLVLGEAKVQILVQLLQIFLTPFLWSIAIAVGIVVGVSFGLTFKKEIQSFAGEIKKSIK